MNKYSLILFNLNKHILDTRLVFLKSILSIYEDLEKKITDFNLLKEELNYPLSLYSNELSSNLDFDSFIDTFKRKVKNNIDDILLYKDEYDVLNLFHKNKISLYTYSYQDENDLLNISTKTDIKEILKITSINPLFDNHLIIENKRNFEEEISSFILKEGYEINDVLLITSFEETKFTSLKCNFNEKSTNSEIIDSYIKLKEHLNVK